MGQWVYGLGIAAAGLAAVAFKNRKEGKAAELTLTAFEEKNGTVTVSYTDGNNNDGAAYELKSNRGAWLTVKTDEEVPAHIAKALSKLKQDHLIKLHAQFKKAI